MCACVCVCVYTMDVRYIPRIYTTEIEVVYNYCNTIVANCPRFLTSVSDGSQKTILALINSTVPIIYAATLHALLLPHPHVYIAPHIHLNELIFQALSLLNPYGAHTSCIVFMMWRECGCVGVTSSPGKLAQLWNTCINRTSYSMV